MVYDLCLALPEPVKVNVHVSDIFHVDVTVVDKVEIGKNIKAYVRVLDSARKPFMVQYLAYMNLELTSSSHVVSIKALSQKADNYTIVFDVHGEAIGQTSLTATATDKDGHTIESRPRLLEVFPPFRLVPSKVTLIIGAMMQITSEGGPQPQSNIKFSVSNVSIASVDENGFVEGVSIGNCTVTGVVQDVDAESGSSFIVSEGTVEIEVFQLSAIRIHAPITRIKSGTQMPVYVSGVTSCQSPFSFGSAIPGLTFHWTVLKKDFLNVTSRYDEVSVSLPAQYNFAISIHAKMKGKTGLRVTVRSNHLNHFYGSILELSDEIQIQVFERLQLVQPNVIAEQILMSPNSVLKLQTNRDQTAAAVTYRIMNTSNKSPIVHVDDKGLLTSGSLTGISTVEINSHEIFGINQTFVISVKVTPVSYVRIVSSPTFHTSDNRQLSMIPLGVTLHFALQFHDSTGDIFHSHNSIVKLATNRDDLVQVEKGVTNNTFIVHTVNVGLTIFHVWDIENPVILDYVPFPVEQSIFPSMKEATVADVICFVCSITNHEGLAGTWTSSSSSLLQIDAKTGVAVAKDIGFVTVYYEVSGFLKTYTEFIITKPQKMETAKTNGQKISLQSASSLRFVVHIDERSSHLKGECSAMQFEAISEIHPEDVIICHLEFHDQRLEISPLEIFTAKTMFEVESGHYSCSIITQKLSENQLQLLSISDTSLTVTASLYGIQFYLEHVSATVPIYPGFYTNPKEIILSHHHATSELKIFGPAKMLKHLVVESGSPLVIFVHKEIIHGKPTYSIYKISVKDTRVLSQGSLSTLLTISSSLSDQVITVPVVLVSVAEPNTEPYPEEHSFFQHFINSYQGIFFMLFAVLAGAAVIRIVFSPKEHINYQVFISSTPQSPAASFSSSSPIRYSDSGNSPARILWS
ncbi:nuclear pore membrane glyco 210 [Pelobates cultripes]|uniref:Nuclear pore membrane glyco 210 n=1 Tax=Pelobates cultripes TaxID=61616 RepID=A0AAD1SZK9_PELCU|nr:nuclear pore membrane glyco 210 [Pelobates cultripes]